MPATVDQLLHYPIKGLSAQPLESVDLAEGQGFPDDRLFGFARAGSSFDPENPAPLAKTNFIMLARDAGLARLTTSYDAKSRLLSIKTSNGVVGFEIGTTEGRADAATFIAAHLGMDPEETPTLHCAHPHRFTDVSVVSPSMMNAVSLINADSVAAFSELVGQAVSPARFRGNIVFSGAPAFEELGWLDRELALGEARLKVVKRTRRCAATEVNLDTGQRDLQVPQLLHRHLGHFDMGIYAVVLEGGRAVPGDPLRVLD